MDGLVGPLVNATLSVLVGMVLWGVKNISVNLKTMNGRIADHIESKDLHYAAQARMEEQIKTLYNTVQIAHSRLDKLKDVG